MGLLHQVQLRHWPEWRMKNGCLLPRCYSLRRVRAEKVPYSAHQMMHDLGRHPQRWNQPKVWRRADHSLAPTAVSIHSTTWIIRLLGLPFAHQIKELRVYIVWKYYLQAYQEIAGGPLGNRQALAAQTQCTASIVAGRNRKFHRSFERWRVYLATENGFIKGYGQIEPQIASLN